MESEVVNNLRERVLEANLALPRHGLVKFTWGNVSEVDREAGLLAIKPSGVTYERMGVDDIVVLKLSGEVVAGTLRPSSDLLTHLSLYRGFPEIGAVVHTHSLWATVWAQAGAGIPCFGTTHCDYFYGEIPCTRELTEEETRDDYEHHTGEVILEKFRNSGLSPAEIPGVLVYHHGPFVWGRDGESAVYHAVVLEELAQMAYHTLQLNPQAQPVPPYLLDKHYLRKHGSNAYYGQ